MKPGTKIEVIPKLYPNCEAILMAPGPSLTPEIVERVRQVQHRYVIIGVGDVYKIVDFMDEHYACDARWWNVHGDKINQLRPGLSSWCHDDDGKKWGAKQINGKGNAGLSTDPKQIHHGSNSGYQAINLAYLWGCTKMILVGYNMMKVNGQSHFFKDREGNLQINSPYPSFAKKFASIQADIRENIVNCTHPTGITAFRRSTLDEELDG